MFRVITLSCIGIVSLAQITCPWTSPPPPDGGTPYGGEGPRIESATHSDCLTGTRSDETGTYDDYSQCGQDEVELAVNGTTLVIAHRNVTYNCCLDDIDVALSVDGTTLTFTETEIVSNPCRCLCCYNVEVTVVDLVPGQYTVEYCWIDESGQEQCQSDAIEIPAGAAEPQLESYSNSGCLVGTSSDEIGTYEDYPGCGEDQFELAIELTAEGSRLIVTHQNATYNCCPDDISVTLSVDGNVLGFTEEEILTSPCLCLCCYDVTSNAIDLAPGLYTVYYCWNDYETDQEECFTKNIVVP